jgi:hypothetical protein
MPLPTREERAGERVYRESSESDIKDRRSFRRGAIRKSGDAGDAANNLANIVQDGVGAMRPTGQHSATPREYASPNQSGPGTPDLVVGVAAGVAMVAEAVRAARARRRRRKEHDGNE